MPGVGSNRADILHAAAIVIDEVMDLTGAASPVWPGRASAKGLVWQELRGEGPSSPMSGCLDRRPRPGPTASTSFRLV